MMAEEEIKIVLDADVIIHFSKGGFLSLLPKIFPSYKYVVLSKVYEETISVKCQLDNQMRYLKNIALEPFSPNREMMREYASLIKTFGKGESACMAYCKYTHNVIGSSNTLDIKDYCSNNGITYLTTLDFLYYAYVKKIMTSKDCSEFITNVRNKGSHLPDIKIEEYKCNVEI